MAQDSDSGILDSVFDSAVPAATASHPALLEAAYDAAGRKYNLNPALLKAQNVYELGPKLDPRASGDAKHTGYGQLSSDLRAKYGVRDPTDPMQAIPAQAAYLREMIDKQGGDISKGLMAYNGGPNEKNWGDHVQAYPQKVLENFPQGQSYNYASPAAAPVATPGHPAEPPDILDSVFAQDHANAQAGGPTAPAPADPHGWGAMQSFGSGTFLGFGPEVVGGLGAAKDLVSGLARGQDPGQALSELSGNYSAYKGNAKADETAYSKQSPLTDLLAGTAGSIIPTAGALAAGQAYGAAPLAARLGAAVPKLAPAMDFLTSSLPKVPALANGVMGPGQKASAGYKLARILQQGLFGATSGALAGGLQAHESDEPISHQILRGATVGGFLTPALAQTLEPLLSHITPLAAQAARGLSKLGVDVPAGAIPGASPIRKALNAGFGDGGQQARAQVTAAASKLIGSDSPVLTDQVLNTAEAKLRNDFNSFAAVTHNNNFADPQLYNDAKAISTDLNASKATNDSIKEFNKNLGTIFRSKSGAGPQINGADYMQLTQRGGLLDRMKQNPDLREFSIRLHDSINDAMQRGLQAQPNGQALSAGLDATRAQWKNLQVLSPLVDDATGQISPAKLGSAVDRSFKRSSRATPGPIAKNMMALGEAHNFVPESGGPGLLAKIWSSVPGGAHGSGLAGGALGALAAEHLPLLENHFKEALMGLAGATAAAGAGKVANRVANSKGATQALLMRALSGQDPSALGAATALTIPSIRLANQPNEPAQ